MAEKLGAGGRMSLWRLADGALVWRGGLFTAAFSPDARYFVYTDIDEQGNNVIIFLSEDGRETLKVLKGNPGTVWRLLFTDDTNMVASTNGSEVRVWRVEDGALLYRRIFVYPTAAP